MARLKFFPKAGLLVPYPGRGPGSNHHAGRNVVVDEATKTISHPVSDEGISVREGTPEAARFIQFCRRDGDVHPADEYTAKACGVPFVPLRKRDDGEYEPVTMSDKKPAAQPPSKKGDV